MSSMSLAVNAGAVSPPRFVDALVVGQLATNLHHRVHRFALDCIHRQHDQSVVEQQHVTRLHIAGNSL